MRASRGFTVIELLLVIGILSILFAIAMPLFVRHRTDTELRLFGHTTLESLERARTYARAANKDSDWGVHISTETGVLLFKGSSYVTRDFTEDERTVSPQGLAIVSTIVPPTQMVFSKVTGDPSSTGSLTFSLPDSATQIQLWINDRTGGVYEIDLITICHHPGLSDQATMQIEQSLLPSHTSHGDRVGSC